MSEARQHEIAAAFFFVASTGALFLAIAVLFGWV